MLHHASCSQEEVAEEDEEEDTSDEESNELSPVVEARRQQGSVCAVSLQPEQATCSSVPFLFSMFSSTAVRLFKSVLLCCLCCTL